jgi:hypothetical protein
LVLTQSHCQLLAEQVGLWGLVGGVRVVPGLNGTPEVIVGLDDAVHANDPGMELQRVEVLEESEMEP